MFEGERLPVDVVELPPGPELAALLAGVDRDRLTGYDRVELLQARARQVAHDQAEMYADMLAVAGAISDELSPEFDFPEIEDSSASEIRAALSWTRRAAEYHLGLAHDLVERLPRVWQALLAGLIDLPRARVLVDQTRHLDSDTAGRVADEVLEHASTKTTGQLRASIQKLCFSVDPESARHRYQQGVLERRVSSECNEDGTAGLYGLQLPVAQANAAMRRINTLARSAKSAHDGRTLDQIRADVFLDLLNGRQVEPTRHARNKQSTDRGMVDLRVDLTTLAGLAQAPGELAGFGPVIADIARQVAGQQTGAEWRYMITDPETGAVVHNGTTRRRPTTALKRQVQTRNPTCVFPGCRMPATDCDLDHNREWSHGGATIVANLAPLCRHDHTVRHRGWRIRQLRPGTYQLTSPLGHTYTTGPDPP